MDEHPNATKIVNNTNKTICFIQDEQRLNIFRMKLRSDIEHYFDKRDDLITCLEPTDWIIIGRQDSDEQ